MAAPRRTFCLVVYAPPLTAHLLFLCARQPQRAKHACWHHNLEKFFAHQSGSCAGCELCLLRAPRFGKPTAFRPFPRRPYQGLVIPNVLRRAPARSGLQRRSPSCCASTWKPGTCGVLETRSQTRARLSAFAACSLSKCHHFVPTMLALPGSVAGHRRYGWGAGKVAGK